MKESEKESFIAFFYCDQRLTNIKLGDVTEERCA